MSAPTEHPASGAERVTSFQTGLSAERRACLYLIATTASLWLAAHPDHANLDCRFDVILIAPRRLPRHLEAAFETSSF